MYTLLIIVSYPTHMTPVNELKQDLKQDQDKEKKKEIAKIAQTMSDVWDKMTSQEQEVLLNNISKQKFQKHDVIYEVGSKPCCLYCLAKGKVKIYKEGVSSRQQIIRIVKGKEFFGYRSSFIGENHSMDAAAMEDTTLYCIPLQVAKNIIKANVDISVYFLKELAMHLGNSNEYTVNLTQKHIRGRLAEALLRLKNDLGTLDDGMTLAISVSREDLANLSNMTTSNAIRTLSAFVQEGLVKTDGRRITILDLPQLEMISEMG